MFFPIFLVLLPWDLYPKFVSKKTGRGLERLFELLCVVKVLKALGEVPGDVRWLGEFDSNQKKCDGLSFYYQKPIPWEHIRKHPLYGDGLDVVLKENGISGLTYRIDCVFEFDKPRNGIDGILIEAKSGEQKFTDAVDQMVLYRALHERRPGTRWLFWGITEDTSADSRMMIRDRMIPADAAAGYVDCWAFSSAERIDQVVKSLGLA